jgi:hypothetical protein
MGDQKFRSILLARPYGFAAPGTERPGWVTLAVGYFRLRYTLLFWTSSMGAAMWLCPLAIPLVVENFSLAFGREVRFHLCLS